MDDQMNYFNIDNNYIKPLNDSFKYANTRLSKNSWKIISREYNKTMVLTKVELYQKYTLKDFINDVTIIHGKREVGIIGTPKKYIKIYTECWQHDSNLRPTIQKVFKELNNISGHKDEEIFTEHDQRNELKEKMISKRQGLNTEIPELLYYINTHNDLTNELKIITTVIKILSEKLLFGDQVNKQNSESPLYCSITINVQDNINDNHQFLYNLNQLFIYQFNKQGVSTYSNPKEVFNQICYYEFKNYFTSIIGFFYEYGIGTSVNHKKALNMYRQAAENDGLTFIDPLNKQGHLLTEKLFKKNQIIGLISLGTFYLYEKAGLIDDKQKAFQLFLESVAKGSKLGKCYVGDCYYYGHGLKCGIKSLEMKEILYKELFTDKNELDFTTIIVQI
ncbi:17465_t:CDS:2 [Gigaspora margarita]|uniref:17465_t:CDS:1 n=1 Tax=Gigaspora margarita TaxID=4874 RepID=A0ABN7UP22_GIGMA|nr:17465_t:CDS:2 [Gigaspora margarita]